MNESGSLPSPGSPFRALGTPLSVPFINLTQYCAVVLSNPSMRNSVKRKIYGVMCGKALSSAKSCIVLFLSFLIFVDSENCAFTGCSKLVCETGERTNIPAVN